MKGLIYPLLGLIVIVSITLLVWYTVTATRARREKQAIRSAKWESYAAPGADGTIEVGIHRVARWGRHHVKVIQGPERMARVAGSDLLSDELIDAQSRAELRAGSLNSVSTGS